MFVDVYHVNEIEILVKMLLFFFILVWNPKTSNISQWKCERYMEKQVSRIWSKFKYGKTVFMSLVTSMTFLSFRGFAHFIIQSCSCILFFYHMYCIFAIVCLRSSLDEIRCDMRLKNIWFTTFCYSLVCVTTIQTIFYGLTFSPKFDVCR